MHLRRINTLVTLDWGWRVALSPDCEHLVEDRFDCERTVYDHQAHECGRANRRNTMAGEMGLTQLARGEEPAGYRETTHSHREDDHDSAGVVAKELAQMQSVELNDAALRRSVRCGGLRLDADGENLTAVVDNILDRGNVAEAYRSWMRSGDSENVDSIETYHDETGIIRLQGRIEGTNHHSESWSSGLLRMAAITALFFQQSNTGLVMIDNVDAGMGEKSSRIVNELLQTQSLTGQRQVITTTSSSRRLNWIEPNDYGTVFIFTRNGKSRATEVHNVSELARTQRTRQPAARAAGADARFQLDRGCDRSDEEQESVKAW